MIVLQESRYILWNEEVREIWILIWQLNCSEGRIFAPRWMCVNHSSRPKIDRSLQEPSGWLQGCTIRCPDRHTAGMSKSGRGAREYARMRM
jgi:hypothetical protein